METRTDPNIFSIVSDAVIKRTNFESPIEASDVENYITQTLWKIFDQNRRIASERLRINELNLKIVNARILEIKIDGSRVVNPEGFTGNAITVRMLMTLTKAGLAYGADFDEGSVVAAIMSRAGNREESVYAEVSDAKTRFFGTVNLKSLCIGEVLWGADDILKGIQSDIGGDANTARLMYKRLVNGDVSPRILSKLNSIFANAVSNLLEKSADTLGIRVKKIFVKSFNAPEVLYSRAFSHKDTKVRILDIDTDTLVNSYIYASDKLYSALSPIILRRIKWIGV